MKLSLERSVLTDTELKEIYEKSRITIIPLKQTLQPSGQSVAMQSMLIGTPVIISEIDGLWANHKLSVETQNAKNRWTKEELEKMDADAPIQHPLVCLNPDNNKKYLFVNVPIFCGSIVGMENEEGDKLLSRLYHHAQRPEFSFRLTWSKNTMVVWENIHCLHYPVSDYFPHERKMLRVALKGKRKPINRL